MDREDVYYRAVEARDSRFDGKFFIGVRSTGIYCRPICPARPMRKNMVFFETAIAADNAGFRPCKRCRPEEAPGAGHATQPVVRAALAAIDGGLYHGDSEAQFAARFAERFRISERHLRRIFTTELGQTPAQLAAIQRLNACRKLLMDTELPVTTIALDCGFQSIRRFNTAFKARFHHTPSQLRRKPRTSSTPNTSKDSAVLRLSYRPPFDWQDCLEFHRRDSFGDYQSFTESSYTRLLPGKRADQVGYFTVTNDPAKNQLLCRIVTQDSTQLLPVARQVRQMFDLDADPLHIEELLGKDPTLRDLVRQYPGLRNCVPYDPFEAILTTILGQLVTVQQAVNLSRQVVTAYGTTVSHPLTGEPVQLLPDAQDLAQADLAEVGTTKMRRAALRGVIQAIADGTLRLSPHQNMTDFKKALVAIKGIGPWTAEYFALKGLGDSDSFPATDLIIKRALDLHPELEETLNTIRPWRGYAAIYLWKHYAAALSRISAKRSNKDQDPPKRKSERRRGRSV